MPDILRLTGLSTKLHNYPDQLSGGEQQRVSIARAFVNHPPLLLADEPTGNLDPDTSIDIMRLLYRINRTGTTVVVATHDHTMVDKMRRRVLELSHGRIVRDEAAGAYARDETTREFARRLRAPNQRPPGSDVLRVVPTGALSEIRILPARGAARDAPQRRAELCGARHRAGDDAGAGRVHPDRPGHQRRGQQRPQPGAGRRVSEVRRQAAATCRGSSASCWPSPTCSRFSTSPRTQAFAQQSKADPQAYQLLGSNPLPDTFHVIPDNPSNVLAVRSALTPPTSGGGTEPLDSAIQTVSNKKNDTRKILEVTNLVTITAAVLTVLLILASVLLIANTIRLSLYARRREVEVMKLVGATDWFIRWPFVIEGTIVGALGALLAIAVLGVTKVALLDPLAGHWTLIAAPRTLAFSALVAVLLGAGVLVSAVGSGLSLRRFLRV